MESERSVSVEEFIDAVEKNGYEQGFGGLFSYKEGKILACAAGQALVNLGFVDLDEIQSEEDAYEFHRKWSTYLNNGEELGNVYYATWKMNDTQYFTPQRIAKELRKLFLNARS